VYCSIWGTPQQRDYNGRKFDIVDHLLVIALPHERFADHSVDDWRILQQCFVLK